MDKKTFALNAIKPYYKDPSLCGYDPVMDLCRYLTGDGKKCVVGKHMINPGTEEGTTIQLILTYNAQKDVFVPEAVNILTDDEWFTLQTIHDLIAKHPPGVIESLRSYVNELGLFTWEEFISD